MHFRETPYDKQADAGPGVLQAPSGSAFGLTKSFEDVRLLVRWNAHARVADADRVRRSVIIERDAHRSLRSEFERVADEIEQRLFDFFSIEPGGRRRFIRDVDC